MLQRRKVFIVALLHFLSSQSKPVELFGSRLAVRIGEGAIEIGKIDVLRLNGVEEFFRRRSLLQQLPMLVVGQQTSCEDRRPAALR